AAELLDGRQIRVEFLNGATDQALLESLQLADIYVSLSRSDGTSVSMLEALSCGLFPVLSDIPANRDWIDAERENGILVPLDDPPALGRGLARALNEGGLRERARDMNRSLVLERADLDRTATVLRRELEHMAPQTRALAGPRTDQTAEPLP